MSFEILADANRTVDNTVPLYESDGSTAVVLAATDVVRVKVSRGGATILDLDSVAATANGSGVTVDTLDPGSCAVRFAQADSTALVGIYDVEVAVVDDSESAPATAIKSAEKGTLAVIGTGDGDVGLT